MNARDALEVVRKASWANEEDAHCGCEHCEKKREAIAALSALVERAGEPVAWIPIETAPKDGTRILLAYPCGAVKFGFYLDNSDTARPWAGWRVTSGELTPNGQPTKWQPLPTAPGASHER